MASCAPVTLAFNSIEPEDCDNEKSPVIFLHGLTASKDYWYEIPQAVANLTRRKVYMVDSRNHGDSPWSDVFNFDVNVDDLLLFMDTIKAPKAILVGHSMGGITSMKTALRAPERVEKIVVEDIPVTSINEQTVGAIRLKLKLAKEAVGMMPDGLSEAKARQFIIDHILNGLPPEIKAVTKFDENGNLIPLKKTEDGKYTLKANLDGIAAAVQDGKNLSSKIEGTYDGPACFIYGMSSPFLVKNDEENIKKIFPKAELVGIEGATHTVHNDCCLEFLAAMLDFLHEQPIIY
ncbi:abhydrolase domain-containing protein C22H12.03 [Caerostris darwini]|uniref:sn-1-specific diacylglycerol lipase ABHD11 n=1 Tax=Caerostris darwini TaxID=1538125 RepID=A0AAV4VYZ3_9ARAC|nr:abhydrolase domain-containing protein C22H12.03 [Caerostris darwini]